MDIELTVRIGERSFTPAGQVIWEHDAELHHIFILTVPRDYPPIDWINTEVERMVLALTHEYEEKTRNGSPNDNPAQHQKNIST